MTKIVGPFIAVVIAAITALTVFYGVTMAVINLPYWVWFIVLASLFGGWLVDRLMFWGMATMAKRKASKSEFTQSLNTMMERIRQNQPPYIPPVPPKQEDLN